MDQKKWESLCDKCGLCCGGCKFLDQETKLCTVYEDRAEKAPWCRQVTPPNTVLLYAINALPSSCAYVKELKLDEDGNSGE
jgi:uncharacterized cysteine cluster protein YcgN (CxxCxxCC family)